MRGRRGAKAVLADEDGEDVGHGALAAQLLGGAGREGGHGPANVSLFGEGATDARVRWGGDWPGFKDRPHFEV